VPSSSCPRCGRCPAASVALIAMGSRRWRPTRSPAAGGSCAGFLSRDPEAGVPDRPHRAVGATRTIDPTPSAATRMPDGPGVVRSAVPRRAPPRGRQLVGDGRGAPAARRGRPDEERSGACAGSSAARGAASG
jgi:hypothetical protein